METRPDMGWRVVSGHQPPTPPTTTTTTMPLPPPAVLGSAAPLQQGLTFPLALRFRETPPPPPLHRGKPKQPTMEPVRDHRETVIARVGRALRPLVCRGHTSYFHCHMQQQELAQMRQRDANLTALAAIGPRKKRKLDSPGATTSGTEDKVCFKFPM
ncbi:hypothetical protein JZ751_027183 [Albula glossodonta]|uniref:Transcription initiation factor TFIID component TAF4 C-terminal domain-containing protein n=1 Tax=Albula glossodonta TaxID=121402 RepID=A0A8T2NFE5_9TELE|nr:hypothetical protein JZ751_027183 [Albula glossodonta]